MLVISKSRGPALCLSLISQGTGGPQLPAALSPVESSCFMASFPSAPSCQDNWPPAFCARNGGLGWGLEGSRARGMQSTSSPGKDLTSGLWGPVLLLIAHRGALPACCPRSLCGSSVVAPKPCNQRSPLLADPTLQRLSSSAGCSGHRSGGGGRGLPTGMASLLVFQYAARHPETLPCEWEAQGQGCLTP